MTFPNLSRWAALCALAVSGLAAAATSSAATARLPEVVPGEVVVGFHTSDALDARAASAAQGVGLVLGRQPRLRAARLRIRNGASVRNVIENLRRRSDVAYVEPVYILRASATPNDSAYASQWALTKTQTDRSWDVWQPQSKVTVAIVDTGIELAHPDLTDVVLRDSGGNVVSYNALTGTASSTAANDDNGHGTHCAGTIAARINNARGVAGVAGWNPAVPNSNTFVQLMGVKVLDAEGSGTDADVAEGIIWAADHGADVISMSLGGEGSSTTLANAVTYARNHGVVVVAAAGNESTAIRSYPAAYTGVISVAATDSSDTLANFSNYGTWVKVAAPGVQIYSTYPGGRYSTLSGTSMATPHVAGEVAAILAQNPNLTPAQVEALVVSNVDSYTPYRSRTLAAGAGRINVLRALQAAGGDAVSVAALSLDPTSVQGGTTATATVTLTGTAPTGGTAVTVFSDATAATVPASVTVPAGQSSTTFTVSTSAVSSATSATLTATVGAVSRTATLQITAPTAAVSLSSFAVNPTSILGGSGVTGLVTLSRVAPAGGLTVSLSSGNAAATVPAGVSIAAGTSTASFTITTRSVSVDTPVTLAATYNGSSRTAILLVQKPASAAVSLTSLSVNPTSVTGGANSTGTVTLSAAAPTGGVVVTLSRNGSAATVPASVTVPAGSSSATFTVQTSTVIVATSASVTASYNGATRSDVVAISPAAPSLRLALNVASVLGGSPVTGTVTLTSPAGLGGRVVTLTSSSSYAVVPSSVTIPQGTTSRAFVIRTVATSASRSATITGAIAGSTAMATLTVRPPAVLQVKLKPATVRGGASTTATVTLEAAAPAGGLTVQVTSNAALVQAPTSVIVRAGAKKVSFRVKTRAVSGTMFADLTANTGTTPAGTELRITRK
jgi:subtilisin family serine protease